MKKCNVNIIEDKQIEQELAPKSSNKLINNKDIKGVEEKWYHVQSSIQEVADEIISCRPSK